MDGGEGVTGRRRRRAILFKLSSRVASKGGLLPSALGEASQRFTYDSDRPKLVTASERYAELEKRLVKFFFSNAGLSF
jgi:hypothetical protein